jgi:hypothetical protein
LADQEGRALEDDNGMCIIIIKTLARLDNFMIQNHLRIILINGTGEGLEVGEPEELSEAERILGEMIQQRIRPLAALDPPGSCQ